MLLLLLFELFFRQGTDKRRGVFSGNNHIVVEKRRSSENGDRFVDVVVCFAQRSPIHLSVGKAHSKQRVEIVVESCHLSRSGRGHDRTGDVFN